MQIFLDTEFIENGSTIELISIGLVREDGAEYYAQQWNHPSPWFGKNWEPTDWIVRNVFPHLSHFDMSRFGRDCEPVKNSTFTQSRCVKPDCPWRTKHDLRNEVKKFCGDSPKFWAYYADYDWVVLCQLFGTMMDLPKGWPTYCRDVKQSIDDSGINISQPDNARHHALDDARWVKETVMNNWWMPE